MAVIVNGDGILTGVSSLTTALDDITSGRGTVTCVATVGTLQLGAGVSISSPRSQNAAIFTNNSEFLTVDDAGRVGVGTVTPNSDAHPQNVGKINVGFITARSVAGDIDANTLVVAGISTFVGALNASSVVSSGAVSGTTGTFTSDVSIQGNTTLGNATSDTITFSGRVNSDLNPSGSTRDVGTSGVEWRNLYTSAGVVASDVIATHAGDNSQIRFPANDMISFETGGTEIARFNNSQLFLVGTDSAVNSSSAKVQIAHTNANARLDISRFSDDSAPPYFEFFKTRNNTIGGNGLVQSGDELGRIRWNGNTGSGPVFAAQIQVFAGATPGSGADMPGEMAFSTTPDGSGTPVERLRITKTGNVGINANSPSAKLTVRDTTGSISSTKTLTANFYREDGTRNPRLQVLHNQDGSILRHTYSTGASSLMFEIGATEVARFNGSGNLAFAAGKGIDFSSASGSSGGSSSALLDDYEEGSWTPSFSYSNGGAPTLSEALGYYVKIGRMVHCLFTTTNSAQGGGSGNLLLNNLPFTSSSVSGMRHNGHMTYFAGMGSALRSNIVVYNAGGTTTVYLYHQNSGNTQIETITRNYITSNTTFRGHITFYV